MSHICEDSMVQNYPKLKKLYMNAKPFVYTEQRGQVSFRIGYLVYELRGYKRMRVVKVTIVAYGR